MKAYTQVVVFLCVLFIFFFVVAITLHPYNPVLILAGESSPGTWLSGVLLTIAATATLITGMRRGWYPWYIAAIFFFILAVDERFMFHEQLKEKIIFSFDTATTSPWLYELPVILGALAGVALTASLWRHLHMASRILLICAAVFGSISVCIDIVRAGVVWEECFKLLAELALVCSLLREVTTSDP